MLKIPSLLSALLISSLTGFASAQSIDLGRGELPLTIPTGYDSGVATPLIVLLHGYTSSGAGQDSYMDFSGLANEYGYILVSPDGNKEAGGDENRFWNASDACCDFFGSEVDDSGYIAEIIATIKADYNINPNRVYLVGHSNGGFMSYRLAYDHSGTIAALASLAGANHSAEREAPEHGVHVLQIHGTSDGTIDYNGNDIQGNGYPSALETVSQWASYNGCAAEGEERELRDLEARLDGHDASVLVFNKGCRPGGSSELWTIDGGSHVPALSSTFTAQVVEWLYAHPKTSASFTD